MNEMTLTDSTASHTYDANHISSPFTETPNFGETTTRVLSGNIYTDYTYIKRTWTNNFGVLTDLEYRELWDFVYRQYIVNSYPRLTLSDGSATNVPVKISIDKRDVVNLCGDVYNVRLTMIETGQNATGAP